MALSLTIDVNDLCLKYYPATEIYSLSAQMRKAADSVVLNIAEGCTGQSKTEFIRFLGYALRSAIEVVACLFIAKKKLYISDTVFQTYYVNMNCFVK